MTDGTRHFLVEITGVAGSGKSTLARHLADDSADARIAEFIHTRIPRHLAHMVLSIPRLLPILARNLVMPPRLSWADVKLLVYVAEWDRFLRARAEYRHGLTLFDQGPVYALVRLRAQGKGVTRSAAFTRWWDGALERWAGALAAVVYLDASDPVLLERIDGRAQAHATKGQPEDAARGFLERYRRLFEEALGRLDRAGGPQVVRVDSGATSADRIAADVRAALAGRTVKSEGRP